MTDMHAEEESARRAQWQSHVQQRHVQARRAGVRLPAKEQSSQQVRAAGATHRQLEYWVEMGWIAAEAPKTRGHPRSFTATELRVLALMVRLTAAGLPARVAAGPAREAVAWAELRGVTEARVFLAPRLSMTVQDI